MTAPRAGGPRVGAAPVPPPPTGPGVQPPFAAPPIDADRTRLWVGLGVGAAALVLCCAGGVLGFGGLVVTGLEALNEQATVTVDRYLGALADRRYDDAYALLCDERQRDESVAEFSRRVGAGPQVTSYTVGEPQIDREVVVPADVRYDTGLESDQRFVLKQNRGTGRFEVCGVE
jgi:hypothetical protein